MHQYKAPAQRERERLIAYHTACIEQYKASADKLQGRWRQRCLDNAAFHEGKLEALTRENRHA